MCDAHIYWKDQLMPKAKGTFAIASWNEEPYHEGDGIKLTRAEVTQTLTGDITGDGSVQWLMAYRPDGTAHFVGLQRIEGSLGGASGSFVAETIGDFDGQVASGAWTVVAGTGTAGWAGIDGVASFGAPHGLKAEFEFDYDLG
jgi:hypothetical protein